MKTTTTLDRKLRERLLLARRVEGDRLVLGDDVLLAALDGSRPLTANERTALEASPLTVRRLRQLALERRAATSGPAWRASGGMLRAADSGAQERMVTDDGWWALHFTGSQVILQLDAQAPFAALLLHELPVLRVRDGAGGTVLEGRLDADGECEGRWPFGEPPARHFQRLGATFTVARA